MESLRLPSPFYTTNWGAAYLGDALELLPCIKDSTIDLIMTSPPFGLRRKKAYGNVEAEEYVAWFLPFAREFFRVLTKEGSLVLDIGGSWNSGTPTKSLYNFELLVALCRDVGFHLAQDFYWFNPAKLPSPAEWVTVRRIRVKEAVNPVWWLSKTHWPTANNKKVLKPYSTSMLELLEKGYKPKLRPSGHDISEHFSNNHGGAIPPNLLSISNTESNGAYLRACREAKLQPHPARFPIDLPSFFIKFLTEENALILDPFAGSNVTGEAAQALRRRWISFELSETYLRGSQFRFLRKDVRKKSHQGRPKVRHLLKEVQRSLF